MMPLSAHTVLVTILTLNLSNILFIHAIYCVTIIETHLLEDHPTDFSLDIYALFLAKLHGSSIHLIPVCFKDRINGKAKKGG